MIVVVIVNVSVIVNVNVIVNVLVTVIVTVMVLVVVTERRLTKFGNMDLSELAMWMPWQPNLSTLCGNRVLAP
jgi:hypothetical protein